MASRQVQEIHMRSIAELAQNARELLSEHPVLGEEIARLRELGAMPHYGGPSPGVVRSSGLPYDNTKTPLMVSKIWKDVMNGRVAVVHSDAINPGVPMLPTPTTTDVKNYLIELRHQA